MEVLYPMQRSGIWNREIYQTRLHKFVVAGCCSNEVTTNFRKSKKVYNKIHVIKVNGSEPLQSQNNVKTEH